MTTVTDVATITTARDLTLFRTLAIARVLDADRLRTAGEFASIRRANRRLLKLLRSGFLRRWFVGTASGGQKALYGLSPQGATLIGEGRQGLISWKQDSLITSSQFLAHQQAINEVFMRVRFEPLPSGLTCERRVRPRVPLSSSIALIPDGYFEIKQQNQIHPMFLEVDLGTEPSSVWNRKAALYRQCASTGESEGLFPGKLRTLVLFHSLRRLQSIRKTIARSTEKVFWLSTLDALKQGGLWRPIWLRPVGDAKVRLLEGIDVE
jgi:hypothetical protein